MTRRQHLIALLTDSERTFEELHRDLAIPKRTLEEELRHVRRSLRREGRELVVRPAECRDCEFVFRSRDEHHLHAPGRCPRCRGERIAEPSFRIAAR